MQTLGKHDKNGRLVQPKYLDGRTKQAFKNETDIVKILARAQKAGTMSHLEQHEGSYGDFADFDFFESRIMLAKGAEVFAALPSELRSEFHQSAEEFFSYVNDPANRDELEKKLPMLAEPGRQNIDTSGRTPPGDPPAAAADEKITPPGSPGEKSPEGDLSASGDHPEPKKAP